MARQKRSKAYTVGKDGPLQRSWPDHVVRGVEGDRAARANKRDKKFHKARMKDETRSNKDRLDSAKSLVFDMMAGAEIQGRKKEKEMAKARKKRDRSVNKHR